MRNYSYEDYAYVHRQIIGWRIEINVINDILIEARSRHPHLELDEVMSLAECSEPKRRLSYLSALVAKAEKNYPKHGITW